MPSPQNSLASSSLHHHYLLFRFDFIKLGFFSLKTKQIIEQNKPSPLNVHRTTFSLHRPLITPSCSIDSMYRNFLRKKNNTNKEINRLRAPGILLNHKQSRFTQYQKQLAVHQRQPLSSSTLSTTKT